MQSDLQVSRIAREASAAERIVADSEFHLWAVRLYRRGRVNLALRRELFTA